MEGICKECKRKEYCAFYNNIEVTKCENYTGSDYYVSERYEAN